MRGFLVKAAHFCLRLCEDSACGLGLAFCCIYPVKQSEIFVVSLAATGAACKIALHVCLVCCLEVNLRTHEPVYAETVCALQYAQCQTLLRAPLGAKRMHPKEVLYSSFMSSSV